MYGRCPSVKVVRGTGLEMVCYKITSILTPGQGHMGKGESMCMYAMNIEDVVYGQRVVKKHTHAHG